MSSVLLAHRAYLTDVLTRQAERRKLVDPSHIFPSAPVLHNSQVAQSSTSSTGSIASKSNIVNYIPEEESIRNDYAEWYGVSGVLGSNHILGAADEEICEEYPALRRLMELKKDQINQTSHPPIYHPLQSATPATIATSLSSTKFDVILINPIGSWESTLLLPIRHLSADPGFVFLWVGRGDQVGLEKGRECLARWGFRRAEDIVWIKTNKGSADGGGEGAGSGGLFGNQKEHCLMGIRGTVRRSTDSRFVHCNVDTDVMVWEDDDGTHDRYPPYLYTLIENFCLGTRRLELFGSPSKARRGWVTAGLSPSPLTDSNSQAPVPGPTEPPQLIPYDPTTYPTLLATDETKPILPFHAEIDALRPKSPQRRNNRGLPGGQNSIRPPGQPGQGFRPPSGPGFRPVGPRHSGFGAGGPGGGGCGMQPGGQPGGRNQQLNPMVNAFQPQPNPQNMGMGMRMGIPGMGGMMDPSMMIGMGMGMGMGMGGMMDPNMMMAMNMAMMNMQGGGMNMGMGQQMGMPMGMGMNQNYPQTQPQHQQQMYQQFQPQGFQGQGFPSPQFQQQMYGSQGQGQSQGGFPGGAVQGGGFSSPTQHYGGGEQGGYANQPGGGYQGGDWQAE